MTRKSLIAILAIFIIPLAAFWAMTFNKDTSVVALASMEKPHIYKFSSTMCLECKEVEKIFKEIMPKYEEKIDCFSCCAPNDGCAGFLFLNDRSKRG